MDPSNSVFVEELQNGWDKYFDKQEKKHFYFNLGLGKRQWEHPFQKPEQFDPLYGPCKNCQGWGKNLVNLEGLCQRCTKEEREQILNAPIPDPVYEYMGPCRKCKGYGKKLVSQYGFCKRCYRTVPKDQIQKILLDLNVNSKIDQTKVTEKLQKEAETLKKNQFQQVDSLLDKLSGQQNTNKRVAQNDLSDIYADANSDSKDDKYQNPRKQVQGNNK